MKKLFTKPFCFLWYSLLLLQLNHTLLALGKAQPANSEGVYLNRIAGIFEKASFVTTQNVYLDYAKIMGNGIFVMVDILQQTINSIYSSISNFTINNISRVILKETHVITQNLSIRNGVFHCLDAWLNLADSAKIYLLEGGKILHSNTLYLLSSQPIYPFSE